MTKFTAILNPLMKTGYGFVAADVAGAVKAYVFTTDATQTIGGQALAGAALRDAYYTALVGAGLPLTSAAVGIMTSPKLVAGAVSGAVSVAALDAYTATVMVWSLPGIIMTLPSVAVPPYPLFPVIGSLTGWFGSGVNQAQQMFTQQ